MSFLPCPDCGKVGLKFTLEAQHPNIMIIHSCPSCGWTAGSKFHHVEFFD